jgi:hypothetical protein
MAAMTGNKSGMQRVMFSAMGHNISGMSTVLRPVGPHEPRVYWLRRGVAIIIVILVILALAKACGGGGSGANDAKKKASTHHPTGTTSSSPPTTTPSSPADVAACDPTKLTLNLTSDATDNTVGVGQGIKFVGAFANPGTSACTFSLAPANEDWTVMSGPALVWSTSGCTTSTAVKSVTIKAGGKKHVSVTWNGDEQGAKCAVGSPAQNGEYTLTATLDGVKSANTLVFHISPPQ